MRKQRAGLIGDGADALAYRKGESANNGGSFLGILRWHAAEWSGNAITAKQGGKWHGATVASIHTHARLDDGEIIEPQRDRLPR